MTATPAEMLIADGPVLLELHGHVGHLQMNRPTSANGLNIEMLQALHAALLQAASDTRVRVLLFTGRGPNFCAGGDVVTFVTKGDGLPAYIREATHWLQLVIGTLIRMDEPVVMAAQGYTAGGGGLGLLCVADLVIAADNAKFLAGATRVGMAPDAGLSVTLPRLIGARRASEWLLMNPTVGAAEAHALGLLNRIVPEAELAATAMTIAQDLAAAAPQAMAATKRLLWTGVGLGVEAVMPEEGRTVAELCRTADVVEGLRAVIEKRRPQFTGR